MWNGMVYMAEHLKHGSKRVLPLLALCTTGRLIHGFLPDTMMSVVLVPIITDKTGRKSDKYNYRPKAPASIMLKVIEIILLDRLSDALATKCNQFTFKPKLGTDMFIY